MDDQLLEIVGKHRLTESLLDAGIEVAFPARDHGIDLIAYSETALGPKTTVPAALRIDICDSAELAVVLLTTSSSDWDATSGTVYRPSSTRVKGFELDYIANAQDRRHGECGNQFSRRST